MRILILVLILLCSGCSSKKTLNITANCKAINQETNINLEASFNTIEEYKVFENEINSFKTGNETGILIWMLPEQIETAKFLVITKIAKGYEGKMKYLKGNKNASPEKLFICTRKDVVALNKSINSIISAKYSQSCKTTPNHSPLFYAVVKNNQSVTEYFSEADIGNTTGDENFMASKELILLAYSYFFR